MAKRVYENRLQLRWECCTSDPNDTNRLDMSIVPGSLAARNGKEFAKVLREYADYIDPPGGVSHE